MNLNGKVIENMINLDFLSHSDEIKTEYVLVKNVMAAEKSMNSLKWENLCLDRIGDVSSALSKHHKTAYNSWNDLVDEAKRTILPLVEKKLDILILEGNLLEEMKDQIKFDIINMILYQAYSTFVHSEFYEGMYKVYEQGYIPCGWDGCFPKGKIIVL